MGKNYSIATRDGVMTIRFSNAPGVEELFAALDDAAEGDPTRLRLWDFSSTGLRLSADEVRAVADYSRTKQFPPSRIAIVAPDDLAFGLSREFGAFRVEEQWRIEVFRSVEEARAWLTG